MNRLYRVEQTRPLKYRVIKNSEVIKVGDFIVDEATGAANVDAATEQILGIAVEIVTSKGVSLESPSVSTSDYDGTWAASTKSYTATADNESDKLVKVGYIPLEENDEVVATLDADKGTTTGSNKAGYNLAILTSDSSLLDESTASASTSNTQFRITNPLLGGSDREVVVQVTNRQANI